MKYAIPNTYTTCTPTKKITIRKNGIIEIYSIPKHLLGKRPMHIEDNMTNVNV